MHCSQSQKLVASLLLVLFAAPASAQRPTMPEAFHGEWAVRPEHCFLPHASNLRITEHEVDFRPLPGGLAVLHPVSDRELDISLWSADRNSSETRRFQLSPDGRQLTDLTDRDNPLTRIRCDMVQPGIIGLVEIPALPGAFSWDDHEGEGDARATGPVKLFVNPESSSAAAVTILHHDQLVSRERGYDQIAAAVYDQVRDLSGHGVWYKVGYAVNDQVGYAWLESTAAGPYHPLGTLLSQGLAHMTDGWDRRLFARPDAGSPVSTLDGLDPQQTPGARVISTWRDPATGKEWYLVAVVHGQCSEEPMEVIGTGWVPAHAASGVNTVWFYSRGC